MPKQKYIGGVDFFYCPKGVPPRGTMKKATCRRLTIPQLKRQTGINENDRYRWKQILGFFPKPARGGWYNKPKEA